MMLDTMPASRLSSRYSSPLRGRISKSRTPANSAMSSANSPAALITNRPRHTSVSVRTVSGVSGSSTSGGSIPTTRCSSAIVTPLRRATSATSMTAS